VALLLISGSHAGAQTPPQGQFTMEQTLSDGAQRTTIAFSGLALMTGNLEAQSFYPPGKVADYTGFQYLRDNDPDNMGHNTSFLTRVANNVIYILNDSQFQQLKALASAQSTQTSLYGYQRYPLMTAFRRLIKGSVPTGATGLSLAAVSAASRELYLIDGQIAFDRALLYANILSSMTSPQKAYLEAMKGKGFNSWPDIAGAQIDAKMRALPQGTATLVMTYAGDLFSWYAGSLVADVYFCPERHGTYYGGFYIKDAPAVGHEGYSISEQLTNTAGSALSDSSLGYVTSDQAALMSSLVDTQRNNLYTGSTNIVQIRTQIATLLRSLLLNAASSDIVKSQVLTLSGIYGELDGENNYNYASTFAQIYGTLTSAQKTKLAALRTSIMSGRYADGTVFDYSVCATPFLYSEPISDISVLAPYVNDTDSLFSAEPPAIASFTATPSAVAAGQASTLSWSVKGAAAITIDNGIGDVSALTSKTFVPAVSTVYTLTATNAGGSVAAKTTVTVNAAPVAPPVIASFTATPQAIAPGGSATLAWKISGARTISIDNGVGDVSNVQSRKVSPTQTTTYYLTATNTGGTVTARATVTVAAPPPVRDAQPPTAPVLRSAVLKSGQIGLSWTAATDNAGVTGYQIFRNGSRLATVSGGTLTYSDSQIVATAGYTYMLKAVDAAGNVSVPSNAIAVAPSR
jgi:hypothetical protein